MKPRLIISSALLAIAVAGSATAATFGPATGAIALLGSPVVTFGAGTSSATYGSAASIFNTTGSLTAANGTGSVFGTLTFSDVVGVVTPEVINGFMTFNDTTGGQFVFNVTSVQTETFATSPSSTGISLYLLGTAGDAHLGLANAPTSETITINRTGASAYSSSATIAAPPSGGVPEPVTWSMMLVGFGACGAVMRKSRAKTGLAAA